MTNKKKILVIPHTSLMNIKVRSMEIAKVLSNNYDVYYLTWGTIQNETLFSKSLFILRELFKQRKVHKKMNLKIINSSRLYRPFGIARTYNRMILSKILEDFKIDIVINASAWAFSLPNRKKCFYIYDLVDDHVGEVENKSKYKRVIENHIAEEVKKSDITIACSHQLVDLLKNEYSQDALYVPNGTDLEKFNEINDSDVFDIREKYELNGKFVIGYIGNHGDHSGLRFLIDVYLDLKKSMDDAVLFIVGPGSEVEALKNKVTCKDIIFTGPISQNHITEYFKVIDIGVLPFEKTPFTDNSLPIKILEYTAAQKVVVSTPLCEVKLLNFPNIYFAERNVDLWVETIEKARLIKWNDFQLINLESYDWKNIVRLISERLT